MIDNGCLLGYRWHRNLDFAKTVPVKPQPIPDFAMRPSPALGAEGGHSE